MGILIEQYRSRIGSHDNFVKTKDTLSHLKNHFLSLMFMMVFYNAYILLLIRQANDVEEIQTLQYFMSSIQQEQYVLTTVKEM